MTAQENKKLEIAKIILLLLGTGVLLTATLVAPNLPSALRSLYRQLKKANKRKIKKSLYGLKKRGLVEISEKKGKTIITITEKGKKKVLKYKLEKLKIKPPKKWDKKWRIVVFDIPDKKKSAREALRDKLKNLGFYQYQKSVFIHPFECRNEIDFLKEIFEIVPYVKLFISNLIDDEEKLKNSFNLS